MAPTRPSAHRSASDTREVILDAARRRFATHGRDGVTMRQVAADTGLTMPTLYHHFGDKSGLYSACVDSVISAAARALRAAFETDMPPGARVRSVTAALCAHLIGNPWLLPFLQLESARGARPFDVLVPPAMLRDIDKYLGGSSNEELGTLSAGQRLVAYAYGYAVYARAANPEGAGRQDVARLTNLLLQAV